MPGRIVASLVAFIAVTAVAPAHAAITASNITAPADGTKYLITDANPATNVPVTGTTNGTTGDAVDIRCYAQAHVAFGSPSGVAVAADGSFSTTMSTAVPHGTCVLRAVPHNFAPAGDASPFTGPRVTTEHNQSSKISGGPNDGQVYDYFVLFQGPDAMNDYTSATNEGIFESRVQFSNGYSSSYLWYEYAASLRGYEQLTSGDRSFIQVDGRNAYGPSSASQFPNNPGLPALTYDASRDAATGNTTIHESNPIVVCPSETPFPPTAGSCPQWGSAGVRLDRTVFTDDGGSQVHITDLWASTDNAPHVVSAHYDQWVEPSSGPVGLKLPWVGDFETFTSEKVFPGAPAGAGGMFVRDNNEAPDGSETFPVGALSFDTPPNSVHWRANDNWTLRDEGLMVPAGGALTVRHDFVIGLRLADVAAKAALNEDRFFGPSVAITAPADGATITRDGATQQITVTGTASDNRSVSVTVNGAAAPVAGDGTFSAPVTLAVGTNEITAVATDGAGNSATAKSTVTYSQNQPIAPPIVTPTPTPALSGLALKPRSFRAAAKGASIARKTGAKVSYRDSLAARTTFTVDRLLPGRRSGKRCVKPTRGNSRAKRCKRTVRVRGKFSHADKAGRNSFRFTGRVGGRKLAPGQYRLNATPRASGKTGATARTAFKVIR